MSVRIAQREKKTTSGHKVCKSKEHTAAVVSAARGCTPFKPTTLQKQEYSAISLLFQRELIYYVYNSSLVAQSQNKNILLQTPRSL